MSDEKFLAIKNWRKYQSIEDYATGRAPWIKDYVGKDFDPERMKLTTLEAAILDRLYRLRARHGQILCNDSAWLAQATGIARRDYAHMPRIIRTLIEQKFIIPTNDGKFEDFLAEEEEKEEEEEKDSEQRKREASRLKKEKTNPVGASSSPAKDKATPKKDCACADGLCDLDGKIGDAVYFQRHVKRNDYFIPRLTNAYVQKERARILADTPADYQYDADPMLKERRINLDGETSVVKDIVRRPNNAKERALLLRDAERHAKWLHDPACLLCKEGWVNVQDYPDDPLYSKLTHNELCECVTQTKGASNG